MSAPCAPPEIPDPSQVITAPRWRRLPLTSTNVESGERPRSVAGRINDAASLMGSWPDVVGRNLAGDQGIQVIIALHDEIVAGDDIDRNRRFDGRTIPPARPDHDDIFDEGLNIRLGHVGRCFLSNRRAFRQQCCTPHKANGQDKSGRELSGPMAEAINGNRTCKHHGHLPPRWYAPIRLHALSSMKHGPIRGRGNGEVNVSSPGRGTCKEVWAGGIEIDNRLVGVGQRAACRYPKWGKRAWSAGRTAGSGRTPNRIARGRLKASGPW